MAFFLKVYFHMNVFFERNTEQSPDTAAPGTDLYLEGDILAVHCENWICFRKYVLALICYTKLRYLAISILL